MTNSVTLYNLCLCYHTGSVYTFLTFNSGQMWSEVQILAVSDGAASDNFGVSVSVSGDMLAVGAFGDNDKGSDSGSCISGIVCFDLS